MFDIRVRLFNADGSKGRVLRSNPAVSIQESGIARLEFSVSERVAGRLDAPFLVGVEYSTGGAYVQPRNGLFIATAEDSDTADAAKLVKFVGEPYVPWLLDGFHQRMIAYPGSRWVEKKHVWPDATPGKILRTLIDSGRTTGWAPLLGCDFSATIDSSGQSWTAAERWSPEFQDLTSLRQIFDAHVSAGLIDWWVEGTVLRAFRPGSGAVLPNVKLGGPGFSSMPVKRQYDGQFTFLTVIAEDGARYYTNTGADQTHGLRHATATLSGVKLADADKIVQPMLLEGRTPKRELAYEWTPVGGLPVPWVDFQVGDAVKVRDRDGWVEQRVLDIAVSKSDSGVTVRATVGNKLLNRLKRTLDKVNSGSLGGISGGTGVTVPVAPPAPSAAPLAPGSLRVASNTATWGEDGSARTSVRVEWDAVTQTTDLADVDGVAYELWARRASEASARLVATDALSFTVEGWEPGVARYVKVRALDRTGRPSEFSTEVAVTPVAPSSIVPKAPTGYAVQLNSGAFLSDGSAAATVSVSWDAVTHSVDGVPVDIDEYEVVRIGFETIRTRQASASFTVPTDRSIATVVRAKTTLGVWGDPSAVLNVTGAKPAVLTAAPSAPALTAGMGGVGYRWDGLSSTGAVMPVGTARVLVETAPAASGPWSAVGTPLSGVGGGSVPATAGTVVHVRFRAFDTLGRAMGTSTAASATAAGVPLGELDQAVRDAIDDAQSSADAALFTADGKNRIYPSVSDPYGGSVVPNGTFEAGGAAFEVRRNLLTKPIHSADSAGWTGPSPWGRVADGMRATLGQIADDQSILYQTSLIPLGSIIAGSAVFRVRVDPSSAPATLKAQIWWGTAGWTAAGATVTIAPGETKDVVVEGSVPPAGAAYFRPTLRTAAAHASGFTVTVLDGTTFENAATSGGLIAPGVPNRDSDLVAEWTGGANASEAILTAVPVAGASGGSGRSIRRSSQWAHSGSHSLRIVPEGDGTASGNGAFWGLIGLPNGVYTATAWLRLAAPLTGVLHDSALRLWAGVSSTNRRAESVQAPNEAGVHKVTFTFEKTDGPGWNTLRASHGGAAGSGDVWWDDLTLVPGTKPLDLTPGDQWWVLDPSGTSIVGVKMWNGTAWVPYLLVADQIIAAESITAPLIKAGEIQVNHVSPSFGADLDISASESVNIIVGRQAEQDAHLSDLDESVTGAQSAADAAAQAAGTAQATANGAATAASDAAATATDVGQRLEQHQTYYRFGADGLSIGDPNQPQELRLKPGRAEMAQNNVVVSYWEGGVFVASEARLDSAQIGNHQAMAYGPGRTIFRPL